MTRNAGDKADVHPRTIYTMRDKGLIERLGRGMYRFADMPAMGNPDLATVAMKVPKGVICLISALSWHETTTEIPHEVYLALPRCAAWRKSCAPIWRRYFNFWTDFNNAWYCLLKRL